MKCSSSPGIPVRTISCAGNNESTARRMTQHHVRMRNDVWTGCIGATLSIVGLLATPLTSRPRQLSEDNGGCRPRRVAFCYQEPHLPKVSGLYGAGAGCAQLVGRADGRFENRAGVRDGRIALPPPLTQGGGVLGRLSARERG